MRQAGRVSTGPLSTPATAGPPPLRAADTTPERPWPVRHLAPKIADYIAKMPPVWVEGQVLNLKRWNTLYFLTLRDTDLDMSLSVTAPAFAIDKLADKLADGAHLVVHARPQFHAKKGTLTFAADDVRLVGLGELLARIEHLKGVLGAEGLFEPSRKRALPFLPAVVGLIVAQQGDAEHDVVSNARARWSAVQFEIRRVTVQGPRAVPEVSAAIAELDRDPRVDVIVVARGGGSFEDLLPFSNESLVRAAAACRTPAGQRDRAPPGHAAAGPRRGLPRLDADRRREADRARRQRGARAADPGPAARPGRAHARGSPASRPGSTTGAAGRCWPTRRRSWTCTSTASTPCARVRDGRCTPRSCTAAPRSPGSPRRSGRCRRPPRSTAGTPWCRGPTGTWCATRTTSRRTSRCASGSPAASSPRRSPGLSASVRADQPVGAAAQPAGRAD